MWKRKNLTYSIALLDTVEFDVKHGGFSECLGVLLASNFLALWMGIQAGTKIAAGYPRFSGLVGRADLGGLARCFSTEARL